MDKLSTFKIGNQDANIYVGETLLNRYTPLEYISSTQTGGQFIDLGCKLMENTDDIEIGDKVIIKDEVLCLKKNSSPLSCNIILCSL